jgi:hypothetical protein
LLPELNSRCNLQRYFKVDGSMEKKWDTVIPADLKRLFVSVSPAGHERVNQLTFFKLVGTMKFKHETF